MRVVTIYSKPDCDLCREAEAVIQQVATRRRFRFEKKNVLEDPALQEQFGSFIPVVHVDGQEIARHRLTAFALETALTS
ncbi:MAG: glutaredoxin family protein [Tepidisphaeraceae bacterium]|jgi:arsenate reductase-like glutaredoxin family protein